MRFDLLVAVRGLRRSPGFALAAVLTLALGIGANTTMFSVVNAVLLRPLAGFETDRLVRIANLDRGGLNYLAPEVYLRLRQQTRGFDPVAANQVCRLSLTGLGEPEQLKAPCVTSNWFELQRAQAMLGRTFLPEEDRHGRNRVLVLGHGYWMRRFGGDPKIVGRTLTLDREPWTVVGVMPPGFRPIAMPGAPLFTPYVVEDNPHGLSVTARLKPGVSLAAARAELRVVSSRLARENPAEWKNLQLTATPLLEEVAGPERGLLLLLSGAASFVLLIACVNVANLLLARSAARRHEIDIRLALGATRIRIARLVLAEALLLSLAASAAAVGMAYGGLRLLAPLTSGLPRADELSIDGRVLACALALGVLASVLFGALPMASSWRPARVAGMASRATARWQGSLVAGEVALAFLLLVGAGLLLRTIAAIRSAGLGYNPRHVLTSFLALNPSAAGSRIAGAALYARIRERLEGLPGVSAAATASSLPMFGVSMSMDVHPEGEPESRHQHLAALDVVSDGYFRVLEIPLRAGRSFTPLDRDGSTRVAVVSESIARRYFGGRPVGRRLLLPELLFNIDAGNEVAAEIVGVAGNVCVASVENCDAEHIYLPESQNALRMENILVRTSGDRPLLLAAAVRHAVYLESPETPLDDAQTLEDRTAYLTDKPRRGLWLLGAFAGLALLLAALGTYSVASYVAARRSREIGIRMAFGAGFTDIAALLFRGALLAAAAGLALGGAAAFWLARLLESMLVGVRAFDPPTLAAAAAALLVAALAAAAGPALRAARTDPSAVLRRE